jgi:hypothetical protein
MRKYLCKLVWAACIIAGCMPAEAFAQMISKPGPRIICYSKDEDAHTQILPPEVFLRARSGMAKASHSTFEVNYIGFTGADGQRARDAFQHAVNIWESLMISTVPIRIEAHWAELPAGTLGEAGPTQINANFTRSVPNTWYPIALTEHLLRRNLNGQDPDIFMSFNRNQSWYLGTDARPTQGRFDLVSVVLHEIAHGLGFFSSSDVNTATSPPVGYWGTETSFGDNLPYIYDVYIEDSEGRKMVDETNFRNPSPELRVFLTSDDLFIAPPGVWTSPEGELPKLYAPFPFQEGSSISHLDEAKYPAGSINSLMTPQFARAEAVHDPGGATLSVLDGLGWRTTTADERVANLNIYPNPNNGRFVVDIRLRDEVNTYTVSVVNALGKTVFEQEYTAQQYTSDYVDISTLAAGVYFVSVTQGRERNAGRVVLIK